jgi:hypothetical protein
MTPLLPGEPISLVMFAHWRTTRSRRGTFLFRRLLFLPQRHLHAARPQVAQDHVGDRMLVSNVRLLRAMERGRDQLEECVSLRSIATA